MNPSDMSASEHRDGRLIVVHLSAEEICKINRQIETADNLARSTNPDAVSAPEVTDMVNVYDRHTRSLHSIFVHRLDYRLQPAPAVGNVVVFSKPIHAPCRAESLQFATPAHYRRHEGLEPGIRDPHDGTLTRDGTEWASSIMGGLVSLQVSMSSSGEPWVYCASHHDTFQELRRLRDHFGDNNGYSTATQIEDADGFAAWLGIDFALGLDKTVDVCLSPIDEIAYARSSYTTNLWNGSRPIDTFVHVYHGPVNYQDVSGRVDRQEQWFDPNVGPMAWFTKKTSFRHQSEYRFAVTTPGTPVQPKHYVAVSSELRELTSVLCQSNLPS